MAPRPKSPQRDRSLIARMIDGFTVAVFVIIAFITLLTLAHALITGEHEPIGIPATYWQ